MRSTSRLSTRRVIALACPLLALLIMVASSLATLVVTLSLGRTTTDPLAVTLLVLLAPLLLIVWVLGGLGLLAQRRPRAIWVLLAWCALVMMAPSYLAEMGASWIGQRLPICSEPVPACGPDIVAHGPLIPYTGGAVVAIIALFGAINAATLYAAWRYVLRPGLDPRRS